MAKPKFVLPNCPTKTLSEITLNKHYIPKLNKLAIAGYSTTELLMKHPTEVLDVIANLVGPDDTDEARTKRRVILSAIFYVLPETFTKSNNVYYDSFQTAKHSYKKTKNAEGKFV